MESLHCTKIWALAARPQIKINHKISVLEESHTPQPQVSMRRECDLSDSSSGSQDGEGHCRQREQHVRRHEEKHRGEGHQGKRATGGCQPGLTWNLTLRRMGKGRRSEQGPHTL